eukprot:4488228-Pyramimonas_sp.AAC.1
MFWERASGHYLGYGVQEGVDFIVMQSVLKTKSRNGELDAAAIIRNLASGAHWTESRLVGAGDESRTRGLCGRCGTAKETPLHRFWQCPPCNSGAPDQIIHQTDRFKERAVSEEHLFCLWLRGLMPLPISVGHLTPSLDLSWTWGRWCTGDRVRG